jgi:curved DNA-binding protein CbpA
MELNEINELIEKLMPEVEALASKYVKIYKELNAPAATATASVSKDFKKIYREISKETHPDRVEGHEDQFKRASVAYKEKNELEMLRVYSELGHYSSNLVDEQELKDVKSSNRYRWVMLYQEGKIQEVKEDLLKFLLNEIYTLEVENE